MSNPSLVLPAYGDGCLSSLIPALLGRTQRGASGDSSWMPTTVVPERPTVLLVLDGLGWNQLEARQQLAPTLAAMSASRLTSTAPSTTATALTSISTGLTPGEHGIVGYRMHMGDSVMNTLRWGNESGDCRRRYPPHMVQPCPPFMGERVPVVSRAEFESTGFTEAHLRGVRHEGWRAASSIPVVVGELLRQGESFVYAYYDGVDKIAHERGFGLHYDAELQATDDLVSRLISAMPTGSQLLVTADHGQVHVGDDTILLDSKVLAMVATQSGEGRFRWLHAQRGQQGALLEFCRELYDDVAWVVSRQQVIDEGWLGPRVTPDVERRLGDVALVASSAVSFEDPADSGPFDLVCRHGSLTADEMYVPFLAAEV